MEYNRPSDGLSTEIGREARNKNADEKVHSANAPQHPDLGYPVDRELLDELDCIVFVADARTWEFTYVNPCAERILGYPVSSWYNEPNFWVNLIHPEDRERAVEYCAQCTRAGQSHRFEYRAIASDGRVVWLADIVRVVCNDDGSPNRLSGVIVDVSETKRMEAALSESEERFRSTFEQAAVGVAHVAPDGTWLRVNQKFHEMIGYTLEELSAVNFQSITHPKDLEASADLARRLLAGEISTGSLQKRYLRKDGSLLWVELTTALLRDDDGSPRYFISVLQDISEAKRAIEALRRSEDRLRRIFEYSNDGIFILDAQKNAVLDVNPKACQIFGDTRERILQTPLDQFYPRDTEAFHDFMNSVHDQGHGWTDDFACRAKSGAFISSEISASTIEIDGRTCILAMVRDVTERKQAEQRLKELNETLERRVAERTAELEQANSLLREEVEERRMAERQLLQSNMELEEFAYAASHDLQEPLRKIASFVDLLKSDPDCTLNETSATYFERIQSAALRMSQLIKALLSYSEARTRTVSFAETDLNEIVRDVMVDLDATLKETSGSVHTTDLPVVEADPVQMRQLFQNLIANGLKFRRNGIPPEINIRAVSVPEDERNCAIEVSDNGIGFEQKYVDRIFAPFQRLHARTDYEGSGVGLAICRRIVERHDGSITAWATPGNGASFRIELRIRQNSA